MSLNKEILKLVAPSIKISNQILKELENINNLYYY